MRTRSLIVLALLVTGVVTGCGGSSASSAVARDPAGDVVGKHGAVVDAPMLDLRFASVVHEDGVLRLVARFDARPRGVDLNGQVLLRNACDQATMLEVAIPRRRPPTMHVVTFGSGAHDVERTSRNVTIRGTTLRAQIDLAGDAAVGAWEVVSYAGSAADGVADPPGYGVDDVARQLGCAQVPTEVNVIR